MANSSGESLQLTGSAVLSQNISIVNRLGDRFDTSLANVDYYLNWAVVESIIYASQIGACLAILIILILLSKQEKRRSSVFIFNSLALLLNIIYALLQCCWLTSSWAKIYAFLSGDYSLVTTTARNLDIALGIFIILVSICIETSLVLQVRVVCITLIPWQKAAVMGTSFFIALVAIGFRIAQSIINVRCNLGQSTYCNNFAWLAKTKDITLIISICFFSAVFCGKLGWSLRERHKLGMSQFGSMQIIFIGGFQTLIIPAIFSILAFSLPSTLPGLGSNILTVTSISLPLTSLWATASASRPSKAAHGPDAHRKFLVDSSTADSTRKASVPVWPSRDRDRVGILASVSSGEKEGETWGSPRMGGERGVERDLELQELKERD